MNEELCKMNVTVDTDEETTVVKRREYLEMKEHIKYLQDRINRLEGEIYAYRFCIRCNGVSGNEVTG